MCAFGGLSRVHACFMQHRQPISAQLAFILFLFLQQEGCNVFFVCNYSVTVEFKSSFQYVFILLRNG